MTAPAPPPGGAGAPPVPPGVAPAPAPPRRWTEHRAPDGRPYWNDGTRSTYAKPEELMTPMERADASTRWRENRAPDGRVYYYHQDTRETRWSLPDDLRLAREAAARAQSAIAAAAAARSSSPAPPPPAAAAAASTGPSTGSPNAGTSAQPRVPRPRDPNAPPRVYADREEAKAAFKELLEDFEIRAGAKWDETAKQIAADERFGALKTIGDKKQCFNEYQTQRLKHEREAKRAADKAARADFTAMLDERWREFGVEDPSTARHRPRLQDHADAIAGSEDPRWSAVKDPRDREDLFRSFCDALRVKLRDEKKKKRDEQIAAFKATLRSMGVDSVVDWTWRRVRDELKDLENLPEDERGGARTTTLELRSIQLEAYEAYADELEKASRLAAKEEKATRLREERRRRDAFVRSLRRRRARGELRLRMPWRTFAASIEDDAAFLELSRNLSGSRPRELYDDEQEEMEVLAAEDRAAVEAAAAKIGFEIVANETTRDALMAAVCGKASLPARATGENGDEEVDGEEEVDGARPRRVDSKEEDEEERLRVACGDAVVAAKERARRAARRKERALDDFYHLLRSRRRDVPITPSSTWADVEPALSGERAWIKCVGTSGGVVDDDGGPEGKGNDPSTNVAKPKETYRADAEAVFVKYVEKLRRREAQAREAMEDGEAMDEGVYDARDDEDVAVDVRRRRERDDLSDEVDGRGGKRERRR